MPYKIISQCFIAVAFTLLFACSGMDSTYKDLLPDSDKLYPGRVDSVLVSTGYKRIKLNVLLSSDPKVKNLRLYWNNRLDSIDVPVSPEEIGGRKVLTIDQMNEGIYSFEMFTFDADKNRSVVTEALGRVYGEEFRTQMDNRYITASEVTKDGEVQITWEKADITFPSVVAEVRYEDKNGTMQNVLVKSDESITTLPLYKEGKPFEYRTYNLPDSTCMDTLVTNFNVNRVRAEFDKKEWKVIPSGQDKTRPAANVIDGNLTTMWHTDPGKPGYYPHSLIIDFGQELGLESFLFLQRPDYANPVKSFEIFTNSTGDDTEEWVSLGNFILTKSTKLQSVKLPEKKDLRYVKMVFSSDWGSCINLALMEIGAFVEW